MEINRERAIEILERFNFFQGQRAGRELWNDKPFEVQEQDIANFSRDCTLLINYIKKLTEERNEISEKGAEILGRIEDAYLKFKAEYLKLAEENTELIKSLNKLKENHEAACEKCRAEYSKLAEENERLRADKKGLIDENEELKNQIQEPYFTEEEIDFIDEYKRLLNEGIRDAKANNVSEIKTRFAMRFGTYTDKDMTPITEVFRLLDQISKKLLEGENAEQRT